MPSSDAFLLRSRKFLQMKQVRLYKKTLKRDTDRWLPQSLYSATIFTYDPHQQ